MEKGIDVSKWQGKINWREVQKDNISFAFIRTSDGNSVDPIFGANIIEAANLGIIVGSYHFFRFRDTIKEAEKQAEITCNMLIDTVGLGPGILPPTLDVEMGGMFLSLEDRVKQLKAVLEKMKAITGLTPILYTFPGYWNTVLAGVGKEFDCYFPWVAHVTDRTEPMKLNGFDDWLFWQFSHTGKVKGIQGDVDLNWFNGDLYDLKFFANIDD